MKTLCRLIHACVYACVPFVFVVFANAKLRSREETLEKQAADSTHPTGSEPYLKRSVDELKELLDKELERRETIQKKAQAHFLVVTLAMTFGLGAAETLAKIRERITDPTALGVWLQFSFQVLAMVVVLYLLTASICAFSASKTSRFWIETPEDIKLASDGSEDVEHRKRLLMWFIALNQNRSIMCNNLNECSFQCIASALAAAALCLWGAICL